MSGRLYPHQMAGAASVGGFVGAASTQQQQNQQPPGRISIQIGSMGDQLHAQEKIIAELRERLDPVITPTNINEALGGRLAEDSEVTGVFLSELRQLQYLIARNSEALIRITQALEL